MKTVVNIGKPYELFFKYMADQHPDIRLIAFQGTEDNYMYSDHIDKVYSIDLSNRETVRQSLSQIEEKEIIGTFTNFENYILSKVWINEFFNLPSISEVAAMAATDKGLMRQMFIKKNPNISPAFLAVDSWEDVLQFVENHQFPLILKPANLVKSLLVTKNSNIDELQRNFVFAQEKIEEMYKQYGVFHRQPQLIIEEFLEGPSFSVDLAVDVNGEVQTGPVVDLIMARDLGVADNYNYSRKLPSVLDQETQADLVAVAKQGVEALEFTNSAAHVELILTKAGPKLIEIGARFGGYRPRMYELSYGIDIHQVMFELSIGQKINFAANFQGYTAVYELFPSDTGILKSISGIDEVKKLPSFHSISTPKKLGETVGLSSQGYKFCANIVLFSRDQKQFEQDTQFLEAHCQVNLE